MVETRPLAVGGGPIRQPLWTLGPATPTATVIGDWLELGVPSAQDKDIMPHATLDQFHNAARIHETKAIAICAQPVQLQDYVHADGAAGFAPKLRCCWW